MLQRPVQSLAHAPAVEVHGSLDAHEVVVQPLMRVGYRHASQTADVLCFLGCGHGEECTQTCISFRHLKQMDSTITRGMVLSIDDST